MYKQDVIKHEIIEQQLSDLQNLAKPINYEVTLVVSYDHCMWLFHIFNKEGKFQAECSYQSALNLLAARQGQVLLKTYDGLRFA